MQFTSPFDESGIARAADGIKWFTGQPETYVEVLRRRVEAGPAETAVIDGQGAKVTYEQLWTRGAEVAGGLRARGLLPGDRVAIDLSNSVPWVIAFVGTLLAGGVAVPIDQRASESIRRAVVTDCDPRVVVDAANPPPTGAAFVADAAPGDLAQLLYTSGTTGEPKGVMATQRNLAGHGEITRRVLRLDMQASPPLRNLVAIQLCHAAGCNAQLLPTLALGGTVVLTPSIGASDIVEVARTHDVDTILSVPAIYQLLAQRQPDELQSLQSLRRLIYGAAPIAESLILELRRLLPDVELSNAFGMTEISNMALYLPPEFALSHHASVGFPVPGVDAELSDADEEGKGELFLRGPNMATGYWRKPQLTAEVFGTGWVSSGDIASRDASGMVYIRDRIKDVINRGGEKIFSVEIEHALVGHPAIDEAAVVPMRDDVMGEKVAAIVVLHDGHDVRDSEIIEYLGRTLPKHYLPERLVFQRTPLPRGSSGKILKKELRLAQGW